jgi:hypothetical protein
MYSSTLVSLAVPLSFTKKRLTCLSLTANIGLTIHTIKAVRISLPARVAAVILRNTLFHNIGFTLEISGLVAAVAHHGRRTRRRRRHRNWGVRLATPYSVDVCPCVTVSLSLVAVCLVSRSHTAYSGGAVLCLLAARAIWVHSILRMAIFP